MAGCDVVFGTRKALSVLVSRLGSEIVRSLDSKAGGLAGGEEVAEEVEGGTASVGAVHEGADPRLSVAGGRGDLCRGGAVGEEPDDLPVAAGDGITRLPIPCVQLVHREVGDHR